MNKSNASADVSRGRVQRPERFQIQWQDASLNQLLSKDHQGGCRRPSLGVLAWEIKQ
ncbi:MAG: hypothetical protein N2C14_11580 [Planctomycetales bacterium]